MIKFWKNCVVIGTGIAMCRLGYNAGMCILSMPIAKMTNKMVNAVNDLEKTIQENETIKQQKRWRDAGERRKEEGDQNE